MSTTPLASSADLRAAPWSKSCAGCRRTYGASQWAALPVVASLPPASVQPHLSVPAVWAVGLRRCACGAMLAARDP